MTLKDIIRKLTGGLIFETKMHHGELEVECVIRKADGTIKSKETAVRPVNFRMDHGGQVTTIEDIVTGGRL